MSKTFEVTMLVSGVERYAVEAEDETEAIALVKDGEAGEPFVSEADFDSVDFVMEVI